MVKWENKKILNYKLSVTHFTHVRNILQVKILRSVSLLLELSTVSCKRSCSAFMVKRLTKYLWWSSFLVSCRQNLCNVSEIKSFTSVSQSFFSTNAELLYPRLGVCRAPTLVEHLLIAAFGVFLYLFCLALKMVVNCNRLLSNALVIKQMLILHEYAEALHYRLLILCLVSQVDWQLQFQGHSKTENSQGDYFGAKVQKNLIVHTTLLTFFKNWMASAPIPMGATTLSFEEPMMMLSHKYKLNLLKLCCCCFCHSKTMKPC